jgi:hypothetical protein
MSSLLRASPASTGALHEAGAGRPSSAVPAGGPAAGRVGNLVFFLVALAVYVVAISLRRGAEVADDGAFFLRYAENMIRGEFWVWNPGEAPVWGASAPLYPLLLALPMALGLPAMETVVVTGVALAGAALAGMATLLRQKFGMLPALAFLAVSALDTGVMYFSASGLETPLTLALLALGVAALLTKRLGWALGIVAGLLMVNKLDLVPAGGLLLVAAWMRDGRFPRRAVLEAAVIAAAWYGFAWLYFGVPVPNSFLTKALYQGHLPVITSWHWFIDYAFRAGLHPVLALLSVACLFDRRLRPLAVYLLGTAVIQALAYSLKPPFEPYNWYGVPAVFAVMTLGAIGFARLSDRVAAMLLPPGLMRRAAPLLLLAIGLAVALPGEIRTHEVIQSFIDNQEHDRSEAGRWVAANTPADAVVLTAWGNPAYHAQRRVIDISFLNRPYEEGDVILKYLPEILILQNQPGTNPMKPEFAGTGDRYRVVKVFDRTFTAGMDYFFVVLARNDVADRITGAETPIDLMRYVSALTLGDYNGLLNVQGESTFFVHPGRTTPTTFTFDLDAFASATGRPVLDITATMHPNVPADAVARGGGTAHVVVSAGAEVLGEAVVRPGAPLHLEVPTAAGASIDFAVDANGVPDTNWLLLSLQ